MGRGNSVLRKANDDVRDFVAGVRQVVVDDVSEAGSEGTLSCTHALSKKPLNGNDGLCVYLHAVGRNITATDTLTFKFYIEEKIGTNVFSEIYQSANYTVVTAGVTAGQVKRFEVDDTDEIIKHATHYSVASTSGIAIPTGGKGMLQVGKYLAV